MRAEPEPSPPDEGWPEEPAGGEWTPEQLWEWDARVRAAQGVTELGWFDSPGTRSLAHYRMKRRDDGDVLLERANSALRDRGFRVRSRRWDVVLDLQWLTSSGQRALATWRDESPAHAGVLEVLARWIDRPSDVLLGELPDATTPDVLVERLLGRLGERERAIVCMRYGLQEHATRHALEEIGAHFGITRERARQLQVVAFDRMNRASDRAAALWLARKAALSDVSLVGRALPLDTALPTIADVAGPTVAFLLAVGGATPRTLKDGWGSVIDDTLFLGVHDGDALAAALEAVETWAPPIPEPIPFGAIATGPRPAWRSRRAAPERPSSTGDYRIVDSAYAFANGHATFGNRAVTLHRMAREWRGPVPYRTLLAPSVVEALGSSKSLAAGRIGLMLLSRARHLFTRLGDLGWMAVHVDDPAGPSTPPLPAGAGQPSGREDRVLRQIEQAVADRGVCSQAEIRSAIGVHGDGDVREGSIAGSIGSRPDHFVRVAPGLYSLWNIDPLESKERALEAPQVEHYVHGRLSGEPDGAFPLWCPAMEMRWCEWGRTALGESLFRALLAVSRPETWPMGAEARREWLARKAERGSLDGFEVLQPSLPGALPPAERVFAALLDLRAQGQTNWMRLSRILGNRLNTTGAWTTLALLVRVGAVTPPRAWNEAHHRTGWCRWLHGAPWRALVRLRMTSFEFFWSHPPARNLLYDARVLRDERRYGWLERYQADLDELLDGELRKDLELQTDSDSGAD